MLVHTCRSIRFTPLLVLPIIFFTVVCLALTTGMQQYAYAS